ncbi:MULTISPECIES: NUDIX domain-containing protein [unclassified Sphingomonas]|uniref:NUDIX domain-containing protein n=1 Tax=unclassified Sphingomonas TaxID=196159 RepID=UPI0006FEDE56|nr:MULTISPECIES: NUDIX domain-containing protein [unclassified Sphingomonas]KQM59904.1 NUDIX hydrolase [Sphingomonas sp. Leaf16]KQN11302.1 NUDIX hydrolase [Sphingomonas sp. Leaf29]KQN18624.1 NUDIX hydrolase [Sphingomonas sp. Leaf32]
MTAAIPAATLILLRDRAAGPPEILMVERAAAMAFAGGALVFPGGRIDPGDEALAMVMGDGDLAPRLAAIRETIEEAGIAIGVDGDVGTMRAALAGGAPIGDLAPVDPSALIPYARWRPDHVPVRVFDTWFYVARLPDAAPPAQVDATENVRTLWITAGDALQAAERAEATLLYPTRRVLERLARQDDVAGVLADARRWPVRTITPWIEERAGERFVCIPDDLGYPVTAESMDRAVRG